ncbi:MAG: hypothetical protein ACRCZD_15325 [Phycicoccus sp.]
MTGVDRVAIIGVNYHNEVERMTINDPVAVEFGLVDAHGRNLSINGESVQWGAVSFAGIGLSAQQCGSAELASAFDRFLDVGSRAIGAMGVRGEDHGEALHRTVGRVIEASTTAAERFDQVRERVDTAPSVWTS